MSDKRSIFNFFSRKRKQKRLTIEERNELALQQAREISDKMAKDREDCKNLFLQKILEGAKAYNEAKADFVKEDEE